MTRSLRRKKIGAPLSALAVSLGLGVALNPAAAAAPTPEWPSVPGAVFALRNANVTTPVVAFDAKGRDVDGLQLCAAWARVVWSLP